MKNLDQIRAANAIDAIVGRGVNDGETVKKIPAYIMNNGLLATAAFAYETQKGYGDVFAAIIHHLKDPRIQKLPENLEENPKAFIDFLAERDSAVLRDVTTESLAYLNYLRRFAGKK